MVTVVAEGIGYEPFGPINALNWGDAAGGYPLTRTFDLDGRMTSSVILDNVGTAQVQQDLAYAYDLAGNITGITDNPTPNESEVYTYDALHRLKTAGTTSGPYYTRTFNYDAVGNRLEQDWASSPVIGTLTYDDFSNRIAARQYYNGSTTTNWTYAQSDSGNRETTGYLGTWP